jgi:signal transduction histidine kinase
MLAPLSPTAPRYPYGASLRYSAAVALGALGLLLGSEFPMYPRFKLALVTCNTLLIVVSAVLGGFTPGLVSTLLCAAGLAYGLVPQREFFIEDPAEIFGVGVFVVSGAIVSGIGERMHRAMRIERGARLLAEQTAGAELSAREATQRALDVETSAQRAREEMLALVAHDLQDPLGVIDLNAGLIGTLAEDPQIQRRAATQHRTAQRMSRLVRDLLDSSALAVNQMELDLATQSVDLLLAETVDEHEPQARAKEVLLAMTVPADLPSVGCDRDRVLQVLSNLVTNAVRFTPTGGRVELRARALDGFVRIDVSDTGAGISPELLPHVFERYSRERRRQGGRTGLGLSIAKAVVERHGGMIQVESKQGTGSIFSFTLPAAEQPVEAPRPVARDEEPGGPPARSGPAGAWQGR